MSNSFVQLPLDGSGKKVDSELLTVGADQVYRERDQIAGKAATEVADVKNTDPNPAVDYGLVVRPVEVVAPVHQLLSSSTLGAGSSATLDFATIPNAKTAKFLKAVFSCTLACKWVFSTRAGATVLDKQIFFTSGLAGGRPSIIYEPKSKEAIKLTGNGTNTNLRVIVTNLDGRLAADVYSSLEWDEV